MKNIIACLNPLFLLLAITMSVTSCSDDGGTEILTRIIELPDSIPYDELGSGKLLFSRDYKFYLIDIDRQEVREYNIDPVGAAVISPDGNMIAYATYDDVIHIIKIDGSDHRTTSFPDNCFSNINWMDSESLIYIDQCYSDVHNMYILSANGNCCTNHFIREFARNNLFRSPVSVSHEGEIVVFASAFENADELPWDGLYTMNSEGRNVKCILVVDDDENYSSYVSPKWSPDGEKIAYIALTSMNGLDPEYQEIVLINPDGTNPQSLIKMDFPPGASAGVSLCWSPDGSTIAFTRLEGNAEAHLFLVDVNTKELIQVTSEGGVSDSFVSWSE